MKNEVVILLQLELTLVKPQKAPKRSDVMSNILEKSFLRLFIITVIKKGTKPKIILS